MQIMNHYPFYFLITNKVLANKKITCSWQGDPLSPYLFLLGMEALSLMIDKATEGGYISGYMFKGRDNTVKQITHLLFADDTLVFCKDTEEQMTHLCWILAWFEALSGLKISLEKLFAACGQG